MEFKQAVVTQNGRALMAKLLAGKSTQFTKIKVSSTIYPDEQLANLTALTNIKQETAAQAYGNNTATVSVVGAIENTGLTTGYYINTVGLYAVDPDKGEILYSVSSASVNGYMPPDTGVSKSGLEFKIYTEVGNATKVDLTVDPAAFATHEDIERVSTLKTAYSWSLDGADRFTPKYPTENLWTHSPEYHYDTVGWFEYTGTDDRIKGAGACTVSLKIDAEKEPLNGFRMQFMTVNEGTRLDVYTIDIPKTSINSGERVYLDFVLTSASEEATAGRLVFYVNTDLGGADVHIYDVKVAKTADHDVYTTAPSEDYDNAYPNYIGLAPGYSDKPEDYVWLPEPTKNQKKLDELVALKDQVADMQSWIQAHS